MNTCHYAIIFGLMIFSCFLIAYGQREVYIFEPDYDIQYCAHKLLYDNFEDSRTYLVAYEGFFSKNALKNKYTHCRIDRKLSEGKIVEEALIDYNKAGFIKRISKTFNGRQHDELYTYTDDNKTIIKSTNYRDIDSKIKLLINDTFYFNDRLLKDSIVNNHRKTTFLYDSSSRVIQITSYNIREEGTETEQDDIAYEQFEAFGGIFPQSGFSMAMEEDAPEALFVKSQERKKNQGVYIYRTEGDINRQLILIQGYRTIYMEKYKSYRSTTLFGEHSASFCQWDSSGALVLYSKYHSGRIEWGGEIFKREGGILQVSFVKGSKMINMELTEFEIEEPIEFKIKKDRIELPYKIIPYYK